MDSVKLIGTATRVVPMSLLCGLAGLWAPSATFAVSPVIAINDEAKSANVSVTPLRYGIRVLTGSGGNVAGANGSG